jgi:hypothetical protein
VAQRRPDRDRTGRQRPRTRREWQQLPEATLREMYRVYQSRSKGKALTFDAWRAERGFGSS